MSENKDEPINKFENDRSSQSFPHLVLDLFIRGPNDRNDMQNIMNNLKVRVFNGVEKGTGYSSQNQIDLLYNTQAKIQQTFQSVVGMIQLIFQCYRLEIKPIKRFIILNQIQNYSSSLTLPTLLYAPIIVYIKLIIVFRRRRFTRAFYSWFVFSLFFCPENWKCVFLYDTLPHNEWKDEPVKEIPLVDLLETQLNPLHSEHHLKHLHDYEHKDEVKPETKVE